MENRRRGLSGFALKRIAVVSMVIDHTDSFLLRALLKSRMTDGVLAVTGETADWARNIFLLKEVCSILGRVAFPIFCFLMVEGFLHTRDRVRYGVRMALFALVSEIPYDLAHYQRPVDLSLQNVMFTLTVCIFTLLLISKAEERWARRRGLRWAVTALVTLAGAGAAYLVRGEYVFLGVLTAVLFYLLREKGWLRVLGLAPLWVVSPWVLLAAPLLLFYSGERGKGSQWFFYVFYPAHFLLFAALAGLVA